MTVVFEPYALRESQNTPNGRLDRVVPQGLMQLRVPEALFDEVNWVNVAPVLFESQVKKPGFLWSPAEANSKPPSQVV